MDTPQAATKYKNHRFPVEILSHAVWLYFRFCLSFRDVEELLLERGGTVTSEAMRKWCRTCGQPYAHQLRRRRPRPGDKWQHDLRVEQILEAEAGRIYPVCTGGKRAAPPEECGGAEVYLARWRHWKYDFLCRRLQDRGRDGEQDFCTDEEDEDESAKKQGS